MEYHGNCEDGLVLWGKECSEGSRGQGLIPGNAHSEERQKDRHCSQGQKTRDTGKWALGLTSTERWVVWERAGAVGQGCQKSLQRRF